MEEQLVKRPDWILTKNEVLRKIKVMLEALQADQQTYASEHVKPALQPVFSIPPKISRGEQYRGLPWMVLDYPRLFTHGNTLAIRTLFWWGEQFSVTLHVDGVMKQHMEPALVKAFSLLRKHEYAICIHSDPWEHHFEKENYLPLAALNAQDYRNMLRSKSFIKVGRKFPLDNWDELPVLLNREYRRLLRLVTP